VGNNNINTSGQHLGRVAVHEAGHWLGLHHIYHVPLGGSNCTPGDFVADTPPQFVFYLNCPTFPQSDICAANRSGNMFMNYMDQTDDPCRVLFTTGQKDRMRSFMAAPGPDSRYPFISNYFGIKQFTSPHIVQNNTITVYMKNPACLDVTYSFTGPVTEISHDNQMIIFSVVCPSSGTVSLTATAANYTDNFTFDFQNQACTTTSIWPKIYEAAESEGFKIDNNGNIFSKMGLLNAANNINHSGVPPNVYGDQYVHYNKVSGYTNWVSTDLVVGLTLNSGVVNFLNHSIPNPYPLTNNFRNGNSGVLVNGPSNAPANEELLVENNGGLITQAGYSLKTYSPSGILVSSISIASIPGYSLSSNYFTSPTTTSPIYNPATNNVYFCHTYFSGTFGNIIWRVGIYHFDPVTYTLSPLNVPSNNQIHGPFVQVNSAEKIFVYDPVNHILEEYNWQTFQYTPLTINNFSNSSLELVGRSYQLVEDRILIKNTNLHYFYCINTGTPTYTATKISYTPPSPSSQFYNYYVFDGTDVFITGEYQGTGFSIRNQPMPLLGSGSAFITKFPLSDFISRPTGDNIDSKPRRDTVNPSFVQGNDPKDKKAADVIDLTLSPNPAKQTLQVTLNQVSGKETSLFFISITNAAGVKVLTTFSNKNNIALDISQLKPSVYYVSITDDKKNVVTKVFLKN
jgi:hypothetical protein